MPIFGLVTFAVKWVLTSAHWTAAVAKVGLLTAGSYLLNRALAPSIHSDNQGTQYQFGSQTTEDQGLPIQVSYGTNRVHANIVGHYISVDTVKTRQKPTGWDWGSFGWLYDDYITKTEVSRTILACFGEGPIAAIDTATIRVNGRPLSDMPDVTVDSTRGLVDQSATTGWTTCPQDFPVGQKCLYNEPVTFTLARTGWTGLQVQLVFPQGLTVYDAKDGARKPTEVDVKIEVGDAIGDTWHTLMDDTINGMAGRSIRLAYDIAATYTGGSAYTLTAGQRPRVRVTRQTVDHTNSRYITAFELSVVQVERAIAFTHPGMVMMSLSTVPTEITAGGIQELSCETTGRIVANGAGGFAVSQYHADAVRDILTAPIITGNGVGTAYAIGHTRGVATSKIIEAGFTAQQALCQETADDGQSGTENVMQCDVVLSSATSAHRAIGQICASGRCGLTYEGNSFGLWIDDARVPVGLLCDGNWERGSGQLDPIPHDELAAEATARYRDVASDYTERSILVTDPELDTLTTVNLDLAAVTRTSEASRLVRRELARNRLVDLSGACRTDIDAVIYEPGDVVYCQIDGRSIGGRITAVSGRTVTLDRAITEVVSGTDMIVVQSRTGGTQTLDDHGVATVVSATQVTIDEDWDVTPVVGDPFLFGATDLADDIFEVADVAFDDHLHASITLTRYVPALDDLDAVAPDAYIPLSSLTRRDTFRDVLRPEPDANAAAAGERPTVFLAIEHYMFGNTGTGLVGWVSAEDEDSERLGYVRFFDTDYQPADDLTGTADRFIYWDKDAPTVFTTTNDIDDMIGKYLVCINDSGTAIYKGGIPVGADGNLANWSEITDDGSKPEDDADVTAEAIVAGNVFHEHFERDDITDHWTVHSGGGSITVVSSGGVAGSNILRIGDNSGDDMAWLTHKTSLVFDPEVRLRIKVRMKQTAGAGTVYAGAAGRNGADNAWVNINGADLLGSQHNIALSNATVTGDWVTYTGYILGTGATGDSTAHADPTSPAVLHEDVVKIRPLVIVNYNGAAGIVEIDSIDIDAETGSADGSMAFQDADSVAITGGTVTGITDLAVADGGTAGSTPAAAKTNLNIPCVNLADYAVGDGSNEATEIQAAIDAAIAAGLPLVIPPPPTAWGFSTTLAIGGGLGGLEGFQMIGVGNPKLKWLGSGTDTMLEITSIGESKFEGFHLDGDSIAGTSGIYHTTDSGVSSQRNNFSQVWVINCPGYGYRINQQHSNAACDYVVFDDCCLYANGVNMCIQGGPREIEWRTGPIIDAVTYGVQIDAGKFTGMKAFFGNSGTCDIYINGPIAAFHLFGGGSESDMILDTDASAAAGSPLLAPNIMQGFTQDRGVTPTSAIADYNYAKPLILIGCKFQEDFNIGVSAVSVVSVMTEFLDSASDSFTGNTDIVGYLGYDDAAVFKWGGVQIGTDGGLILTNHEGTKQRKAIYGDAAPTSGTWTAGDICFNTAPSGWSGPVGWSCVTGGTPGTWHSFGNMLEYAYSAIGKTLVTTTDAASARSALGLGGLATQDEGDILSAFAQTLADDADAATARGTLGLGGLATQDEGDILSAFAQTLADDADAAAARATLGVTILEGSPTAVTSNTNAAAGDDGTHYINQGAGGSISVTFPAATVGMLFRLTRTATQAFWGKPDSGETFRGHAADVYFELGGDGATVECRCLTTGVWDILSDGTITWSA